MKHVDFRNAYYIKLGRQGKWEESSISESKARVGWGGQTLQDIDDNNWDRIYGQLEKYYVGKGINNKGVVTRDRNQLTWFAESPSSDIWITFYQSKLWWCRLKGSVKADEISKYRTLEEGWTDEDINGNLLIIDQMSGRLSKTKAFRGTICRVKGKAKEDLRRLLNCEASEESLEIKSAKEVLIKKVERGLKLLLWWDFETLADLLFTNAGWHRLSKVGEKNEYFDIIYEEPITYDLFQIQVKSTANASDFMQYVNEFSPKGFKRLYFVVHSPSKDLIDHKSETKNVELLLPKRLAQMVVDLGLTGWLLKKIG